MALNDKDKEFIKKTVDDAISKSEKTNQQKMSDAIKSNEEKQERQSKKDRQATLEYLDKVGVLTLAEKMELFKNNISKEIKQTVNEAIPEDLSNNLKDTFKASGSNLGKGLHQGTNSLKALMRGDIFGSVSSALSGSINAGIGLAQGAIGVTSGVASGIGAVGSIISARAQMAEKKKQEKVQKETFKELGAKKSEDSKSDVSETTSGILETKQTTFVEQKEEKTTTEILKKGLGGLSKGLELVNNTLGFIAAKQKLILSGVGLATVGILALVGWFENGGMDRLMDKMKQSLGSEKGKKAKEKADDFLNSQKPILQKEAKDYENQIHNISKASNINLRQQADKNYKEEYSPYKRLTKELQANQSNAKYAASKIQSGLISPQYRKLQNKQIIELKFAFETKITNIYKLDDKEHCDFEIKTATGDRWLYISYALSNSVTKGTKKPLQLVAKLDENAEIFGDWDSFCSYTKEGAAEAQYAKTKGKEIIKKANQILDDNLKDRTADEKVADALVGNSKKYTIEDLIGESKNESQPKVPQKETNLKEETPSVSVKETSTNTEEAQNNIQKIKEAEKKQEQQNNNNENTQTTKENTSQSQANINVKTETFTPDKYSNNLRPDQYNRAANNPLNI